MSGPESVKVEAALVSFVTWPAPEIAPERTWAALEEYLSVAPLAIEIAPPYDPPPSDPPDAIASVPPPIVVAPENVFTEFSVSRPAPVSAKPPVETMAPFTVVVAPDAVLKVTVLASLKPLVPVATRVSAPAPLPIVLLPLKTQSVPEVDPPDRDTGPDVDTDAELTTLKPVPELLVPETVKLEGPLLIKLTAFAWTPLLETAEPVTETDPLFAVMLLPPTR